MDIQTRTGVMNKAMKLLLWLVMLLGGAAHANTVIYVYTDLQGTPLAETDSHGNITATFDYTPYGSQALGTPPNGPGYTGHVNDADTGLVYMQARYYDPVVGRFLSVDPVDPTMGNTFNFNRYDYAQNNPILNVDPDGRDPMNLYTDPQYAQELVGHLSPNESRVVLGGSGIIFCGAALVAVAPEAATTAITAKAVVAMKQIMRVVGRMTSNKGKSKLTDGQAKNLARFEKKFSKANRNVQVSHGKDETMTMRNEVPGKVPGSKAVYEKTVNSSGKTTSATKTTYAPKGEVVHVKDKLNQ